MTDLSPAAQAVLDAANGACMYRPDPDDTRLAAAAALRAAADQIVPVKTVLIDGYWYEKEDSVREQLLAIADELEGQ